MYEAGVRLIRSASGNYELIIRKIYRNIEGQLPANGNNRTSSVACACSAESAVYVSHFGLFGSVLSRLVLGRVPHPTGFCGGRLSSAGLAAKP
jgi:hypothetical protein